MLSNQLGRRNLTPDQFTILLGQRYLAQKQSHGGQVRGSGHNDHSLTSATIAADHGVSEKTVRRAAGLVQHLPPEKLAQVQRRAMTLTRAKQEVRQEHREAAMAAAVQVSPTQPAIAECSYFEWLIDKPKCDLLLTDPPYSTDVANIEFFAKEWLPEALSVVKSTGRAYVFIGAYPDEIAAYVEATRTSSHVRLDDLLVWTYRNHLGPKPTYGYKLNWQAILYFVGRDAPPLECPDLMEQFTVHDVPAPDGRQGDNYHTWQKPLKLVERFVRHSTRPGDLVYDCFAGTGSHLIAAARLGRRAEGCDVDPEMVAIAVSRGCRREQ
jgi:16S rRNA G966 N2-methylase RsmD